MNKRDERAWAKLQAALGAEPVKGCGNHGCRVQEPVGMAPNGPCRCPEANLPALALSVRQPWAWAIVQGFKGIENRCWERVPKSWRERRGRVAIHAARGMTRREYEDARRFMEGLGLEVPPAFELRRGGIIGSVRVVDVVEESESPWFFGPLGLVLADPRPCEFVPAKGRLGYFPWSRAPADSVPNPARWMFAGRQLDMLDWLGMHPVAPAEGAGEMVL